MAQPGENKPSAGPPTPRPDAPPGPGYSGPLAPDPAFPPPPPPPGGPAPRGLPFLDVPGAPPATPGDAGTWILFALIGFVVGQLVAYAFVVMAAALAGQQVQTIADLSAPPEWYVGMSLVGLWLGFLLGPWLASWARGTNHLWADLGVRFRPIDALGIVIGVVAQYAIDLAYSPFITNAKKFGAPTTRLTGAAHGWGFVVIAVMTVVGAPFFEELFFRGLLFKALARVCTPLGVGPSARRTAGLVVAVVLDGLLFGLAHGEWEQFAGLAAFGMVLAVISYRTGRLGLNMVTHASFNLVAVIAVVNSRGALIH
jgi:uncharacterized protein